MPPLHSKNTPAPKIYYWQGAIGNEELLLEHHAVIHRVLNGETTPGDNLERLAGHRDLYSVRLNIRSRLLFTTHEVDGKNYLFILTVLPQHEYERTPFMASDFLKKYRLQHAPQSAEALSFIPIEERFMAFTTAGAPTEKDQAKEDMALETQALHYFNQQFIELDTDQNKALQYPLPLLVRGVAGSGKSSLTMAILSKELFNAPEPLMAEAETPRSILYVSQSPQLVDNMRETWAQILASRQKQTTLQVQFKTYDELLNELVPLTQDEKLANRKTFNFWYEDYSRQYAALLKIQHRTKSHLTDEDDDEQPDNEMTYQEFRICCAYTQSEYLALGHYQSSLPKGPLRAWIYKAYQDFQHYLTAKNLVYPEFKSIPHRAIFDQVICDEAPDLSYLQLTHLYQLAKDRAAIFCVDIHQHIFDRCPKSTFLYQMMSGPDRRPVSEYDLKGTYRCLPKIAAALNCIIDAKYMWSKGLADKLEVPRIISHAQASTTPGRVFLFDKKNYEKLPSWIIEASNTAAFAIVTEPEFIPELKQKFKNARIFTPSTIKGLEFPTILIYQLFSDTVFRTKALSTPENQTHPVEYSDPHRPKAGQGDSQFTPYFNKVYTAYSRAQHDLIICETKTHYNAFLFEQLSELQEKTNAPLAAIKPSTQEDWIVLCKKLLSIQDNEQARQIFLTHIDPNSAEFIKFVDAHRRSKEPVHLPPKPLSPPHKKSIVKDATKPIAAIQKPATHAPSKKQLLKNFTLENFQQCQQDPSLDIFQLIISDIIPTKSRFELLIAWILTSQVDGTGLFNDQIIEKLFAHQITEQMIPTRQLPLLRLMLTSNKTLLSHPKIQQWVIQHYCKTSQESASNLFLWILENDPVLKIFSYILKNLPNFLNLIMGYIPWLESKSFVSADFVSPLAIFLSTQYYRNLFLYLLNHHPTLFQIIPLDALHQIITDNNSQVLISLMMEPIGVNILKTLILRAPEMIKDISVKAWTTTNTTSRVSASEALKRYGSQCIPHLIQLNPALKNKLESPYKNMIRLRTIDIAPASKKVPELDSRVIQSEAAAAIAPFQDISAEIRTIFFKDRDKDPILERHLNIAQIALKQLAFNLKECDPTNIFIDTKLKLLRQKAQQQQFIHEFSGLIITHILGLLKVAGSEELCHHLIFFLEAINELRENNVHMVYLKESKNHALHHAIIVLGDLKTEEPIDKYHHLYPNISVSEFLAMQSPHSVIIDPLLQYISPVHEATRLEDFCLQNHIVGIAGIKAHRAMDVRRCIKYLKEQREILPKRVNKEAALEFLELIIDPFLVPERPASRHQWKYHERFAYFYIQDEEEHLKKRYEVLNAYFSTGPKGVLQLAASSKSDGLPFLIITQNATEIDLLTLLQIVQIKMDPIVRPVLIEKPSTPIGFFETRLKPASPTTNMETPLNPSSGVLPQ